MGFLWYRIINLHTVGRKSYKPFQSGKLGRWILYGITVKENEHKICSKRLSGSSRRIWCDRQISLWFAKCCLPCRLLRKILLLLRYVRNHSCCMGQRLQRKLWFRLIWQIFIQSYTAVSYQCNHGNLRWLLIGNCHRHKTWPDFNDNKYRWWEKTAQCNSHTCWQQRQDYMEIKWWRSCNCQF